MQKGGSQWSKEKDILGFLVNGKSKTISIPKIKTEDIVAEIRIILKNNRIKIKRYRRIIGNICHVYIKLPGTEGLFWPINKVLKGEPPIIGLGKSIKF